MAERAAADFYEALGYRVLEQNLRIGRLELDLVARRGPVVVLVEVRARGPGSYLGAFASVGPAKRGLLRRSALALWERFRGDPTVERVRVDVAAVDLWGGPVRVEVARAVA